jgi:hypothetical protein
MEGVGLEFFKGISAYYDLKMDMEIKAIFGECMARLLSAQPEFST